MHDDFLGRTVYFMLLYLTYVVANVVDKFHAELLRTHFHHFGKAFPYPMGYHLSVAESEIRSRAHGLEIALPQL